MDGRHATLSLLRVYRLCGRGSLDERLFREVYVSASTSDPDPADPVAGEVLSGTGPMC